MSPTSSLSIIVAAARRTSPGLRPYCCACASLTVTCLWGAPSRNSTKGVLPPLCELDRPLALGGPFLELDEGVAHPLDVGDRRPDGVRLAVERGEIVAE